MTSLKASVAVAFFLLELLRGLNHASQIQPQKLVPDGFGSGKQPQISISAQGILNVVFTRDHEINWVQSTDGGTTFSAPAKVADVPDAMVGMRRGPRVAAANRRVVVSVPGKELLSFLSDDGGKSWSQPIRINDRSGSAAEGLHSLIALSDGSFYAVWLDGRRAGHPELAGARLEPGSTVWGASRTVYASPDKMICQCCHPSLATDGAGNLVVMWRNWLQGSRDLYYAESSDRGDTFSSAIKLGVGTWPLPACPMDGGAVIDVPRKGVSAVWRRRGEVYLSTSSNPEQKLGDGAQPVLAATASGIISVWQQNGNLLERKEGGPGVVLGRGTYPSIVATLDGAQACLVWEDVEGNETVPRFAVLR